MFDRKRNIISLLKRGSQGIFSAPGPGILLHIPLAGGHSLV